jgi:hypothetical protein
MERLVAASRMRLDSPDEVACRIWDTVERGDDAVPAAGPEKLYVLLQCVFPRLVDWTRAWQTRSLAT